MDFEQTIMELLINAGEARPHVMSAIQYARKRAAHEWIGADEDCGKVPVTLILVHAQDHLMNAKLCRDLAEEIVLLRREMFAG